MGNLPLLRTRLFSAHVVPQFIRTRNRIVVGVRSFVMAAVFALVTGCGGGGMHAASLPAVQGASEASAMNATFPQSVSPAAFRVEPMPETQRLPASAAPGLAGPERNSTSSTLATPSTRVRSSRGRPARFMLRTLATTR